MAQQNNKLNLTFYLDYENNESGFRAIMSSLDKLSEEAEKNIKNNSSLFDKQEMEKSIQEYKKYIERIKESLEISWDPNIKKFDLDYAKQYDTEAFDKINNGFKTIKTSIVDIDDAYKSSAINLDRYKEKLDDFKLTLGNAFRYNVVNEFVDVVKGQISDIIYYIKDLDKALNNIRIVSGESAENMYEFAKNANETAKGLARTATEYAQAAQIYYQQGLAQEDVIKRTNDTLILANITGDSVADAADKLTSVMNGYQLATEDSTRALDVMAKLGADTATDFAEIASAMQKVSAQANSANLSLEQTTAMLATIMSITREAPETVGTSLKAIIARLNELKFASGEETSRIQKQFKEIGLSIFDANGDLKETTVLFDEIAEAFETADKNTKAVIATAVAGAEQQNRFITLMDNWDIYNEYLNKAYNSSGAALEQNEIYMESIEAKSKTLKSTIDSIKFDLFMGTDYGTILDILDGIAVGSRELIDNFGGLSGILVTGGALMAKMFAPELMLKFSKPLKETVTPLLKDISKLQFNNLKNDFLNLFKEDKKLNSITTNLHSEITKMQFIEETTKNFGEKAGENIEKVIASLQKLDKESKKSIDKFSRNILGFSSVNQGQEVFAKLKPKKNDEFLNYEESFKNIGNNLKKYLIDPSNKSSNKAINVWADKQVKELKSLNKETMIYNELMERVQNAFTDGSFSGVKFNNTLIDQIENIKLQNTELEKYNEELKKVEEQNNKIAQNQKIIDYASAATIAIHGLYETLKDFSNDEVLSGFSSFATTIGTSLMMIPQTMPVGAVITAFGAIGSVAEAALKEREKANQEYLERELNNAKNFFGQEEELNNLINTYDTLNQKINKTQEEQDKFNNIAGQISNILDEKDLIAYYDSSGKAVYKTTEQVKELTEAYRENAKASLQAAAAAQWNLFDDGVTDNWDKYLNDFEKYNKKKKEINEKNKEIANLDEQLNNSNLSDLQRYILETRKKAFENMKDELEDESVILSNIAIESKEELQEGLNIIFDYESYGLDENAKLFADKFKNTLISAIETGDWKLNKENTEKEISDFFNFLIENSNSDEFNFQDVLQGNADAIEKLSQKLEGSEEYYDIFIQTLRQIDTEAKKTEETINNFSSGISNWNSSLEKFDGSIQDSKDILQEFNEEGQLSFSSITKLNETFGTLNGFDEFINKLNSGKITNEEFKNGLLSLIDEYWNTQIAIDGVTESNKNNLTMMLKSIGVINAEEIANQKLIQSQWNLLSATNKLSNTFTKELIVQLQASGISSDFARQEIFKLQLQMIKTNETNMSFNQQITALQNLAETAGLAGAALAATGSDVRRLVEQGMTTEEAQKQVLDNYISSYTKQLEKVKINLPDFSSVGGTSGGGGGSSAKVEEYKVQVKEYEKLISKIEELDNEIKNLENDIELTDNYQEKNKLIKQQNELYEKQKSLQIELNKERDKEIQQNIKILKEQGFNINYDPELDKLEINNLEHINELKASGTEETNELRKNYEQLINDTKELNKQNQESINTWDELTKKIKDNNQAIDENNQKEFKIKIDNKLFNKVFFEDSFAGLSQIKEIYEDVLSDWEDRLEQLYSEGKDNNNEYVQEAIEEIHNLKKEIYDLNEEILDTEIDNLDQIDSLLEKNNDNMEKRIAISGKKIELINKEITNSLKEQSKSALTYVLKLYSKLADAITKEYEKKKEQLEKQIDDYDSVISAVTGAIDDEIDRIKEEQEALEKVNEEKEREIELMKLKAALEAAKSQKTIQVYHKDQGFVWEADQDAIRDAQEDLDEFYREEAEQEMQDRIDELEKYKEQWESIPDEIKKAENEALAAEILGADWQSQIFGLRQDILSNFKDTYSDTMKELNNLNEEYQKSMDELAKDTEETQNNIREQANKTTEVLKELRFFAAMANGQAPTGLQTGDMVVTNGGTYQVSTEEKEGYNYNEQSGYWSQKVGDYTPPSGLLNGQQITDPTILNDIYETLSDDFIELLENNEKETKTNSSELKGNTDEIKNLNKSFDDYTDSINDAIANTDASAKAAKASEEKAEEEADKSEYWASEAQRYAEAARSAASSSSSSSSDSGSSSSSSSSGGSSTPGTGGHEGLNMGPVGSYKGKEFFDKNFLRIANGDLQNDEMIGLLKKDEAIFTPEQLNNVVGSLNYSLNTIDKLSKLNTQMFSLGQLSSLLVDNNFSNKDNNNNTTFGDIYIQMYGVNNVEDFSNTLKNNIKNIFAQAVAVR